MKIKHEELLPEKFFVGGYSHEELRMNLNALDKQGYEIIHISYVQYQDSPWFTVIGKLRPAPSLPVEVPSVEWPKPMEHQEWCKSRIPYSSDCDCGTLEANWMHTAFMNKINEIEAKR